MAEVETRRELNCRAETRTAQSDGWEQYRGSIVMVFAEGGNMSADRARTLPRERGRTADAERVPMLSAIISAAAVEGNLRRDSWIRRWRA